MNKLSRLIGVWAMTVMIALSGIPLFGDSAQAQTRRRPSSQQQYRTQRTFESGYRNGYGDGYKAGKDDYRDRINRDCRDLEHYHRADHGYLKNSGELADFQEGYRLGLELGYVDGYYGRPYSSQLPLNAVALRSAASERTKWDSSPSQGAVLIPDGTHLRLRLNSTISTKTSREGDRFTATALEPAEYRDATVTGHVAKIDRSGRITGRTEMALEFDSITLRNGRSGRLNAQLERVHESDSVKSVDEEGNVETASKGKETAVRTGGGAAIGAIIGAIAGGGKGAAIGAIIGAGAGAGSVYIQGKKDLILDPGTELTIQTSAPQKQRDRE
jgi:hypothetical protein